MLDGVEFKDCPKINASGTNHLNSVVEYVQWCISKDRKVGALKQLQGHIWDVGYASKEIVSAVYDDVPTYFQHLNDSGVQISIYSSGSREAQRLLFKYSNHGDIRPYISCYFDTKVGQKRDSDSYKEIFCHWVLTLPHKFYSIPILSKKQQQPKKLVSKHASSRDLVIRRFRSTVASNKLALLQMLSKSVYKNNYYNLLIY